MEAFKDEIVLLVTEGKGDVGKLLLEHEDQKEEIAETIRTICSYSRDEQVANFIATKLMPALLTLGNARVRTTLLDVCCELIRKCPIKFLSKPQIKKFKNEMGTSYIANLEVIRKTGDSSWSRIWMLLVRYLQEQLHTDVQFANMVFRVVEAAFKTPHYRMGAYDCWIELIRNYQSSGGLLKNPKHIKLLVMPLKVKVSPLEAIERKRFEVWTLLLKVLQDSAIQVLDSFLNNYFCGVVKQSPDGGRNRAVSVLKEATEVFLEILGHKKLCRGVVCWKAGDHGFDAIVTPENFKDCYESVINAAVQCVLLQKWASDEEQKQIATCLWSTLSALTKNVKGDISLTAKKKILDRLEDSIMTASKENTPLSVAIVAVLELDITEYAFGVFKQIFTDQHEGYMQALTSLLESCKEHMEASKLFKLGFHIFSDNDLKWTETSFLPIWTLYHKFFYTVSHAKYLPKDAATFLVSYVSEVSSQRTEEKLQNDKKWCELFNKLRTFQLAAIAELTEIVETKEKFYLSAASLLDLIEQACGKDVEKREYCLLQLYWKVLLCIMEGKSKTFDQLSQVTDAAKSLMKVDLRKFSDSQQKALVNVIAECLNKFVFQSKIYHLLESIETFVKSLPRIAKPIMENALHDQMFELSNNSAPSISATATAICTALTAKQSYQHPSIDLSRGAKLTSMLRNSLATLKSTNKSTKELNTSLPNLQRRSSKEFPAIFGKSNDKKEEFVAIDTEVKFDKSKLSAHQKEQLKKRKDDIPSLYVDLTQDTQSESLSQDTSNLAAADDHQSEESNNRTEKIYKTRRSLSLGDAKAKLSSEIEAPKKSSPRGSPRAAVQATTAKTDDFSAILGKETPRVVLQNIDAAKVTPERTVVVKSSPRNGSVRSSPRNGSVKSSPRRVSEKQSSVDGGGGGGGGVEGNHKVSEELERTSVLQENEQIDQELEDIAAAVAVAVADDKTAEVQSRKRGRPPGSANRPKTPSDPQSKRGRRGISAPSPTLLTDRINNASPSLTRELARLKIDARIDKLMPGIEEINTNSTRVTRRLSKKEQKPPETVVTPESNSTQVVESSQETIVRIKPLGEEPSKKETESESSSTDATTNNSGSKSDEHNEETAVSGEEVVEAKKDTESCDPYEKFPVQIEVDLGKPAAPVLTSSGESAAEKDTESATVMDDGLPGSPITVETPTRTSELFSNTSEISPIRSKTPPPAATTPETPTTLVQKTLEEYMQQPSIRTTPKSVMVSNCGNRSKKIVDLVNNQQVAEEKTLLSTPVREEGDPFLTFSRELPSSSAVPAGGSILKRKKPDFTDDNSPCVKRKRVNFPDPPITSEKLIHVEKKDEKESTKKAQFKKCKKQLIMIDSKSVIDAQMDSETDSDSLEVRPTDSTSEESVEDCLEKAKDSLIQAISAIDQDNESNRNVIKQTLRDIGNAVDPVILGEYLQTVIREWSQFGRNN